MEHEIHRVTSFQKLASFTLTVQFDDGTSQTIDFRPVLEGDLYGPLQDPAVFAQVHIDPEVRTLVCQMVQILTQRFYITGPNQDLRSRL
jgi:hypothetical protein